jgi:hypothetical protein
LWLNLSDTAPLVNLDEEINRCEKQGIGILYCLTTTQAPATRTEKPACMGPGCDSIHARTHQSHQYCVKVRKDRAFRSLCCHGIFRAAPEPLLMHLPPPRCASDKAMINDQVMHTCSVLEDQLIYSCILIARPLPNPESLLSLLHKNTKESTNGLI